MVTQKKSSGFNTNEKIVIGVGSAVVMAAFGYLSYRFSMSKQRKLFERDQNLALKQFRLVQDQEMATIKDKTERENLKERHGKLLKEFVAKQKAAKEKFLADEAERKKLAAQRTAYDKEVRQPEHLVKTDREFQDSQNQQAV